MTITLQWAPISRIWVAQCKGRPEVGVSEGRNEAIEALLFIMDEVDKR